MGKTLRAKQELIKREYRFSKKTVRFEILWRLKQGQYQHATFLMDYCQFWRFTCKLSFGVSLVNYLDLWTCTPF